MKSECLQINQSETMSDTMKFADLDILDELKAAVAAAGYDIPTDIQQQAIPAALDGRDILGVAQTGTGKTAAFALPLLNHLASGNPKTVAKRPQALILAPTRELAMQIGDSFETYGQDLNLSHVLIYGGVGQGKQVDALQAGVHILVATPGRLIDLIEQGQIYLNRLQVFVVDEADRMMDMGFLPDLKKITKLLPLRRQTMFFSATMPPKVATLGEAMLHDPVCVNVTPKEISVELIDQRVIHASHQQKKPLLVELLNDGTVGQAIVFMRTRRGADSVADYLKREKIPAEALHGNLSQNQRTRVLDRFRNDKNPILVATDLAARGLDVEGLTHVYNFELPPEPETYIHRIGRTGRAGSRGIAISLCCPEEKDRLEEIERLIGFKILEDGREPEPLTVAQVEAHEHEEAGRKNRRRRRGRTKHAHRGDSAGNEIAVEEPTRPTAAERKAARNKRHRPDDKKSE